MRKNFTSKPSFKYIEKFLRNPGGNILKLFN